MPKRDFVTTRQVLVLDADGDGRSDILIRDVTRESGSSVEAVTMHMGANDWSAVGTGVPNQGAAIRYSDFKGAIAVVDDIDGDGRDEIVESRDGFLVVREWDAGNSVWIDTQVGEAETAGRNGDMNGDGVGDILVGQNGSYRTVYGCANTNCRVGQSAADTPLPAFKSMPLPVADLNGDGRPELVTESIGHALQMHLSQEDGTYRLDYDWYIAPDAIDFSLRPRDLGDFYGDGRLGEFLIATNERTMLFETSEDGKSVVPVYEWRKRFPLARAPWDAGMLLFSHQDPLDGTVWLQGFTTGTVPEDTPPPRFTSEFVCPIRDTEAADISVDPDLIKESLAVHYQEFTEDACEIAEACVGGPGRRKLLDFSVAVQNFGGGVATVPGPDLRPDVWHADACHGHDHLVGFATYDLLDSDATSYVTGHKQGYYIVDVFPFCDLPSITDVNSGELSISPGWSDIYYAGLDCQWIDITDVPDGDYTVKVVVNANNLIPEDDVLPNTATVEINIAGDTISVR
tara:strand:+ start:28944 stop:30485 length:1542 start_codon:yes stop_codon:yes gene_type:complete